jgi:hypothetical protein
VYALPFDVNLRKVQDLCYGLIQSTYPQFKQKAQAGDRTAGRWVADFKRLSDQLLILLD